MYSCAALVVDVFKEDRQLDLHYQKLGESLLLLFSLMEATFKLRLPGSSGPGFTAGSKRCKSVVSNVLAPTQKARSAQPQPANQEPSEQQQQPWGWVPLNGLKLQWPASNAVELEVQAQQEVRSVARRTCAPLPLDVPGAVSDCPHVYAGACCPGESSNNSVSRRAGLPGLLQR